MGFEKTPRVLFKNIYMYTVNGLSKGFIYVEDGVMKDYGLEPRPEYELSELVYDFEYKAIAFYGFSYAIKPSTYPYRCSYIREGVRENVEKYIKASLIESIRHGLTYPIIFDSPAYIDRIIQVLRTTNLKAGIVLDRDSIDYYRKYSSFKNIEFIILDGDLEVCGEDVTCIGMDDVCSEDNASQSCSLLYIEYTTIPYLVYHRLSAKGVSPKQVFKLLTSGYRLLKLGSGFIEKNVIADILVYDLRDLKTPLLRNDPLSIVFRGYPPDIIVLNGEVVVEREYNYIVDERVLVKDLDLVI